MLNHAALAALNHLLQGAAWARGRLAPFAGRTLRLTVPPLHLHLVVDQDGFLTETGAETFDVEITLPAATPLLVLGGAQAATRDARISGSAEFADAVGFVLRNLRWDFEEDLSRGIGDIAAHRIATQLKTFGAWQQDAAQRLGENLVEYLTEERPTLARPTAIAEFSAGVQRLDADLAALESRLARLTANTK